MRVQNGMLFAWLVADFGERYVVSMYYCYSYNNGPYLAHMWRVPECVRVGRVVICMHTCALEGTGGCSKENEMRGRTFEEWVISSGMVLLYEPSEHFTYSGVNEDSDIDVSLIDRNMAGCYFR